VIVSWNWLNRYVDLSDLDPVSVAHKFTITTAEIEEVILPPTEDFLNQFEVAEVLEVNAHPNADKLRCCKVKSQSGTFDIVCGAPNVEKNMKTILAPIGTKFDEFVIKKTKLRGEASEGMLCSEKELKVSDEHAGLVVLPADASLESKISELYPELPVLWDLDNKAITHRPDLWGHYGIARELAAIYNKPLKDITLAEINDTDSDDGFSVTIENPEVCRRYCGLSLSNAVVKESESWMQSLLKEVGLSPINNIVDITNFVMLELGQPNHAFDTQRLNGKNIAVGFAKKGEAFKTLTEKELELKENNLVIKSGESPVALAGVMGGENSSIDDKTSDIFLEAAHFDALCIRKTAQQHDLRTDSSSRFEKSLDPENAPKAIKRQLALLNESCSQIQVNSKLIDSFPAPISDLVIDLDCSFASKRLGVDISKDDQINILTKLGFIVEDKNESLSVKVPSYRNTKDIEAAIDLVEEIGRIYGYDKIIPIGPKVELEPVQESAQHNGMHTIQDFLIHHHYNEVITYSFTNESEMDEIGLVSETAMKLKNPVNKEQTHMRTTLVSRILEVCKTNSKNMSNFKLFELGKVFEKTEDLLPNEIDELMCVSYGQSKSAEKFFELKNDILLLLQELSIYDISVKPNEEDSKIFHPARSASLLQDKQVVGMIGECHPTLAKVYGFKERLTFAILYNPLNLNNQAKLKFKPIQKFPIVPFSLSLLVPLRTNAGTVMDLIKSVKPKTIQNIEWKENFSGDAIPEGQVSMTIDMNFVRADRTMSGEEIEQLQNAIVKKAASAGYHLRAK
jgi:phenylalanyl-tRNA synthetase beta chain